MVFLVKKDNTPPLKWKLGLISGVTEGDDGLVRVTNVRIGGKVFKRPIHKLCALPFEK
jgi:hypothetical protein